MSINTNVEEKRERVIKTIRREEVDKPPFLLAADGYFPFYAGVEKSEVTSYEKAVEVVKTVAEDLQFDTTYFPFMPANLMVAPILQLLGGGCHVVKDYSKQIFPEKVTIMESSEYPELIANPSKFLLEKALPRRLDLLGDKTVEEKTNGVMGALGEMQKVGQYYQGIEEAGVLNMMASAWLSPVDYLLDFLRDFTGIMADIRRMPEQVRDAGLAILEEIKPAIKLMAKPATEDKAIFMPMHTPAYMRPKDFEKVYWPSYQAIVSYMIDCGFNVACYFEKKYGHLFDTLQDLPKQNVIGLFQEDDMRMTKEKLGQTMTVAGGLSTTLLQHGTKEECIDHVKGLIDDLCPGGGYFIAPDMPMMFAVDGKPENVKAVADYIRDYRL